MSYSKSAKPIITIAAISDVHSNVFALEAVLKDIKQRNATQIVNLGDILYGPIAPKATYELLMKHQKILLPFVVTKIGRFMKRRRLILIATQLYSLL